MRPYAVRLSSQDRAGQAGRHPVVAAEQLSSEERIMRGDLRRSRDGIIGRRARLGRFFLEGPRLAAVGGADDGTLETACGALLLIAKRNAEERRQHEVAEALILVRGRLTLPLIGQRVLLLTPGLAAIVGRPDAPHLSDH